MGIKCLSVILKKPRHYVENEILPKEIRDLGAAAAAGKQEEALDNIVNSNLPNRNILYSLDSKQLTEEIDLKKLFGKASPYMPAPEIKDVPQMDAPVKKDPLQEIRKRRGLY